MSRRFIVALLAMLGAALPGLASDTPSDAARTATLLRTQRTAYLEALFASTRAAVPIETEDGVAIAMPSLEVVVARVGPDGKVLLGCVDSASAAKRFLEAPMEKGPTRAAVEK